MREKSRLMRSVGLAYALITLTQPATAAGSCRNGEPALAELFTDWWCATSCNDARLFLYRFGIPFAEYETKEDAVREKLFRRSGQGTVPAIYLCRKWVFGFGKKQESELRELLNVQSADTGY